MKPTLAFEPLEQRLLLSTHTLPTSKTVPFGGAVYTISVSGPGSVQARPAGHQSVAIKLFGTTSDSQVTIARTTVKPRFVNSHLPIGRIGVRSGLLGSIQALNTADLAGPITSLHGPVAALQFDGVGANAQIDVRGTLGQLHVAQNLDLHAGGRIHVSSDLTGGLTVGSNLTLDGGHLTIDRDLLGPVSVGGNVTIIHGGSLAVGRDLSGGITTTGNLSLATGGTLSVGRDLNALTVGGNIDTWMGGTIQINGNLNTLTVTGFIQGKGTNDLVIGLNLGQLTVLGGGQGVGSVRGTDIAVGKNIQGLDVRHGIFNSLITAGALIEGGAAGGGMNGANIGPDGPVAVFDSEIRAGVQIRDLTISGDVVSDHVRNPAGRPTRIVAGEDRQGNFEAGGNIDNFQITGALIDSVLAASVKPNGGNGQVTTVCGTVPGDGGYNTYDAPAGTITGTVGGVPVIFANFTAPPYDPARDPTIDDCVLSGAINRSFAPSSGSAPGGATSSALPSKSTVLGGVVSTPHGDEADFAGIFAADTSGVFVGVLPK